MRTCRRHHATEGRSWGIEVSDRGRIPANVIERYEAEAGK